MAIFAARDAARRAATASTPSSAGGKDAAAEAKLTADAMLRGATPDAPKQA